MTITPVYAGLLGLLYVALALNVISIRRAQHISLGDGGDDRLQRRMRAHGNFAEYTAFSLLLIGFAEFNGAAAPLLHALGLALLAGRLLHAYALTADRPIAGGRTVGMVLTFTTLVVAALACFWTSLL